MSPSVSIDTSSGIIPFAGFDGRTSSVDQLRALITENYRTSEELCVARLLKEAANPPGVAEKAEKIATELVLALRRKGAGGGVQELVREFSLSSQEGVALMCLAEALLRIPDSATRDALIRDKVGGGNWRAHIGKSPSIFVNAATWGLVITGRLATTSSEENLSAALLRLISRGGEPVLRRGVDLAMRMMGEQFVIGQTIKSALTRSRKMASKGFGYSYDMLGEAAVTAGDAERYYGDYVQAIHAIGKTATGNGVYSQPGISIKLSALHPRYCRAQRDRVMSELLPRVQALCVLAKDYNIGLNIDAEEADRLEISLDLLEALSFDKALANWNGLGFVVQAYQKRAPFVLDFIIDLARRSAHRIMVRLVKGAYWDSEIKRAQIDGMSDFPVFTRKSHTDVSYLACARKLLAANESVFPQFATHNAQTFAAIDAMAGPDFHLGAYEFQCLHGMGETMYEEIVGPTHLNRPCRIYAPVGTHETLLAYLVRRLLENGANSSFVHRIQDSAIPLAELVADPVSQVLSSLPVGAPHSQIVQPRNIYLPERINSAGIDLSNEATLASVAEALRSGSREPRNAVPMLGASVAICAGRSVLNPADHRDCVGTVSEASVADVDQALVLAEAGSSIWSLTRPKERADILFRAADLMEKRQNLLFDLLIREAGKSLPNAVSEVREAVDFLRYYAALIRDKFSNATHRPLGPIACISPWNFPLAIFAGQIAAALAAGNPVVAKPAEETPLIAAEAVAILHKAGISSLVLQLLPGDGKIGAALVANRRTRAVMFTGSTDVAKSIHRELSKRLNPDGRPVPLIAETGGQNALIVDSSALAEQVILDVLTSAFDSAGQRCSALRVLCLQDDVADKILGMLKDAMTELSVGNPDRLSTDIGPVITGEARDGILNHIKAMGHAGHSVYQTTLPTEAAWGTFLPPTIIEIDVLSDLKHEVFGPVLHVLRFPRKDLAMLVDSINATGYGLTFGVHSRLDETVKFVTNRIRAGNIYVNRNLIGATVGVQPFGGHGLSGTGPKAGGPLYLNRLLSVCPLTADEPLDKSRLRADWIDWLDSIQQQNVAGEARRLFAETPKSQNIELAGPAGEQNIYSTKPRGKVGCVASTVEDLLRQISTVLATGNRAVIKKGRLAASFKLQSFAESIIETAEPLGSFSDAILFHGDQESLKRINQEIAALEGFIVPVIVEDDTRKYPIELLVREQSLSINTAAAGGNASLMMIS